MDPYHQLLTALDYSLTPNQLCIDQAHTILTELSKLNGYGVILVTILSDSNQTETIRHAAAIQLRRYCETNWGKNKDLEEVNIDGDIIEINEHDKSQIRAILPNLLADKSSKIRTAISSIIGIVANEDYPTAWPNILEILFNLIVSNNFDAVKGGVRALLLIVDDVEISTLPNIFPYLSSALMKLAINPVSIRVQMRSITIYHRLLRNYFEHYDVLEDNQKSQCVNLVLPSLHEWLGVLIAIIKNTDTSDLGVGFGSRTEAIKIYKLLIESPKVIRKLINKAFPELLNNVWYQLTTITGVYVSKVVNGIDVQETLFDEDGETVGVDNFLQEVFDFYGAIALSGSKEVRQLIHSDDFLIKLIGIIILIMQQQESKKEIFFEDPNEFIASEEDFESFFDVRTASKALLARLINTYCNDAVKAISISGQAALIQSQVDALENAWKLKESSMLAIGLVARDLPDVLKALKKKAKKDKKSVQCIALDLNSFLSQVVLPEFDNNNPFIKARAVWCGCQFATHIPESLLDLFAQKLVILINPDQNVTVRLTTASGIGLFLRDCVNENTIKSISTHSLAPLCDLLKYSNEDTLHLILDTLTIVIENVDSVFVEDSCALITPALFATWSAHFNDPLVSDCITDVFEVLSKNPSCSIILQRDAFPTLLMLLNSYQEQYPGVIMTCIKILNIIICSSSTLLTSYSSQILPLLLNVFTFTADHDTLHVVCDSISIFLRLGAFPFELTNSLFECIFRIFHLDTSEEAGSNIGKVLIELWKCNNKLMISENKWKDLIYASLIKLECAKNLDFIRSVILFYIRIINSTNIDFFTSLFKNMPDIKLTDESICSILQKLHKFYVNGYPIITNDTKKRVTRSNSHKAISYTQIPLTSKIFVLLLDSWSDTGKNSNKGIDDLEEGDYEDDEEFDDEEFENRIHFGNCNSFILDQMNHKSPFVLEDDFNADDYDEYGLYEDEPVEDDTDLSDPFGKIDVISTITISFEKLETSNAGVLNYLSQTLSDDHRRLLESICSNRH